AMECAPRCCAPWHGCVASSGRCRATDDRAGAARDCVRAAQRGRLMIEQDTLFNLLPAIYRIHDAAAAARDLHSRGVGPLQSLLRVLSQPLSALAINLEQLYDDAFIETCDDWVVPYIGDLIGTRPLPGGVGAARSTRAEVAHTIAFRRRKGT